MSFGVGYINVQIIFQNLFRFDMPFLYDTHISRLIPNPKLKQRWKMPMWAVLNSLVLITLIYCVIYEIRLFSDAEKASKINPELFTVHGFILVICIQQLVTFYTFERDPPGVTQMVSSAFRILGIKHIGLPTPERLPDLPEIFCYNVAIGFFLFPLVLTSLPFIRSYDPANSLFQNFIPNKFLRNAMASSIYSFPGLLWAMSCSSYILLAMSTTHAFESLTGEMLRLTLSVDDTVWKLHSKHLNPNPFGVPLWKKLLESVAHATIRFFASFFHKQRFQQMRTPSLPNILIMRNRNESVGSLSLRMSELPNFGIDWKDNPASAMRQRMKYRGKVKTFREVYRLHCLTRMLITVSNKSVEAFVPVMTTVGIILCVTINFSIIKVLNYIHSLVSDIHKVTLYSDHMIDTKELTFIAYSGIFVGLMLIAVVIGLIIFFCKHASQPLLHSGKYIHFWRNCQMLPCLEQRQARAMSTVAFYLGPFFKARKDTALLIGYKILDLTITLLLGLS